MPEKVTDSARRVVVLAREEARMLNHNYIGTEHLLLGLIREGEGLAYKALDSLGISLDGVREQVRNIIGEGQLPPAGDTPFTPRAGEVLALALREARRSGQDLADTQHVLLGLFSAIDGVATDVILRLGSDVDQVRSRIDRLGSQS